MLNVPWYGQPCVACGQPLHRLWVGVDSRAADPSLVANVGVPCGCVRLVEVERQWAVQPTLPLELVPRRSPSSGVGARW